MLFEIHFSFYSHVACLFHVSLARENSNSDQSEKWLATNPHSLL